LDIWVDGRIILFLVFVISRVAGIIYISTNTIYEFLFPTSALAFVVVSVMIAILTERWNLKEVLN
jgi:hypothetical protein